MNGSSIESRKEGKDSGELSETLSVLALTCWWSKAEIRAHIEEVILWPKNKAWTNDCCGRVNR